jgi:hypothetical protein
MPKRAGYVMVPEDDPQWLKFWNAYPKRVAKKEARKAWARLRPSPVDVERMLIALAWQTQQPAWLKNGGAYVPYPASWLNAERWDDEPPEPPDGHTSTAPKSLQGIEAWMLKRAAGV